MHRKSLIALLVLLVAPLSAQTTPQWRAVGTPSGAPPGCSTAAAAAAIDAFFAALRTADSVGLARSTAPRYNGHFDVSINKISATDSSFRASTVPEMLTHARKRARVHERITVQQVTFNYWRGHRLEFGPIYYLRSADDLGPTPRAGIGKGEYWCGKGISALYIGPRPSYDPGPSS
jgi:hypothetical protein